MGGREVRKFIIAMVAAVLGFLLGALVGSLCGMLWIFVFPADRITGGQKRASISSLAQDLRASWLETSLEPAWPCGEAQGKKGNPRDLTILF
jgi:hypothetical protein